MRRAVSSLGLTFGLLVAAAPVMAERTLALVIGIDAYQSIPTLAGAVNDARDIADMLTGIGAETTLLLDADATRDAIMDTWADLAAQLLPGDRLIVTFAGHGSNEVATDETEDDGRDENWLLAGFSPFGPGSGERIRDNEIAALVALSPQAQVILLSDSCHSGTVSREIDPPLGFRFFRTDGTLADDPLPPPPPPPVGGDMAGLALFLGAVPDAEKVPEFLIDGQPRGALSHAFAAGLRGAADDDGNGQVTAAELELFVRAEVRAISRGLQRPQISAGAAEVIFALSAFDDGPAIMVSDPAPLPVDPLHTGFADLPPVSLAGLGNGPAPQGAVVVPPGQAADLALTADGNLTTMVGDLFATPLPGQLQPVLDNARLIAALMAMDPGTLSVRFAEGDGNYRDGDRITVQVAGRTTDHIALFNLAPDGTVMALYPLNAPGLGVTDPVRLSPDSTLDLAMQVGAPYGSDVLVAIQTNGLPPALHALLSDPMTPLGAADLWAALQADAATAPQVALFPFHSRGP